MTQIEILWPVVALAVWTLAVLGLVPLRRFAAVGKGQVTADDFALGETARVPAHVSLANRNVMNLLELPILFYVVTLCLFVTTLADPLMVYLAWTYVVLRVVHSLIHVTYNRVIHRLIVYALSNFVLIALWIAFGLKLWAASY